MRLILLLGSLFGLFACVHVDPDSHLKREVLQVGGVERVYYWKRPVGSVRAVIFGFHGGGGDPRRFDFVAGKFGEAANAAGFAVVYPEGLNKQWNDGRPEIAKASDDLAFFDAMLQDLGTRHQLPVSRVFATGISNGGLFSFRLACERSEKLHAIAPVAAGMGKVLASHCHPKEPVSIIQFFGSKDPLIPMKGGEIDVPFSFKDRGEVISQAATWDFWQKQNLCKAHEKDTYRNAMGSDFFVERDQWSGCPGGVEGTHYLVVGGGHTWPGGAQYLSEHLVGAVSKTFLANPEILRFFERHLGH